MLDDLDDSPINNQRVREKAVAECLKFFGGGLLTAGQEYVLGELLAEEKDSASEKMPRYSIEQFGHVLRAKLVKRWVDIHIDEATPEDAILRRRDEAERVLSDVMTRNVVPSVPLFLITLLQSLDVGKEDSLRGAGLGHYYEHLLTEALITAGARKERLVEFFSYLSKLAWRFHTEGSTELSLATLTDFNKQYSEDWVRTDLNERLGFLVSARVLDREGDHFSFRYPYVYYLMKAKYIAENLTDEGIRAHVTDCCSHLEKKDNAHTILFLSHYSIDKFVLDSVIAASRASFPDLMPLKLEADLKPVEELIGDAPKLALTVGSPEENRLRVQQSRDAIEARRPESDHEPEVTGGTASSNLTAMFKTSEILGQLLRDQYPRIDRVTKKDIITEIFDSPMRGLAFFYQFLADLPPVVRSALEQFTASGEAEESDSDKRKKEKAQRFVVSMLVQYLALSFISRAAESARSEEIADDVAAVVKDVGTNSYQLIDVAIELDSQRPLPREKLSKLKVKFAGNIVATNVLQFLLWTRLMMFHTTAADRQWAIQEFSLKTQAVQAMTLQTQNVLKQGGQKIEVIEPEISNAGIKP